jgi:hypothetical protein
MNPESKTYKLGRAFSPRSTGVAGIFLIIGLGVLAFNHPITWAIGSFFILLFSFVAFTQKRLYLETEKAAYRNAYVFLIEFKMGWKDFNDAKGLIIRYARLTDATGKEIGGWSNQAIYNKSLVGNLSFIKGPQMGGPLEQNIWFVEAAYSFKNKSMVLAGGKEEAFDFVNQMVEKCDFEVYLGHYKNDRKLNRNKLQEQELVFQKKPKVLSTRRR